MVIFLFVFVPLAITALVVLLTARALRPKYTPTPVAHPRVADLDASHYPYAVTLTVTGMDTEHSARRVQDALNVLGDIWAEQADWQSGSVRVLCKNPPDTEVLRRAVTETGCTVLRVKKSGTEN
jgi:hypothetical protein